MSVRADSTGISFSESYSKYAQQHAEVVEYVKHQINVDLNKYRDGDGSSPSTTSYWDKNGAKVAIDLKGMSHVDRQALMQLSDSNKPQSRLRVEQGGAWIGYVYLK